MTLRESDSRIVPLPPEVQSGGDKPSNIGAGKAAGISRDPDQAPPVLSDGTTVIIRLDRSHTFAVGVLEHMPSNWPRVRLRVVRRRLMWLAYLQL
jgi:hypothetical protein